jgi:hypothetical protein
MKPRWFAGLSAGLIALAVCLGSGATAKAEPPTPVSTFFYYPYYYYAHNYWPSQGPPWPEQPGQHYMRPPAYMAYPPFLEPAWRYDLFAPHPYYRGFHFWLDQF